jgi:hexosaminidase
MNLTFDARIVGTGLHCEIGSDTAIAAPVFCCSNYVPSRVVSGGTLVRTVAGYTEVALPNIPKDGKVRFVMAYVEPDFAPKNRAWLPLGPYLRTKAGPIPLPGTETGVRVDSAPPRTAPEHEGLRLIPQPTRWVVAEGSVPASGFACSDPGLSAVADLAARMNLAPFLDSAGVKLTVKTDPDMAAEAYRLDLAKTGILATVSGDAGLFHAGVTLLTLRETHRGQLPCGTITDAPRFGWRGQHLDCARHFYTVETILRLLDLLALLKLNRFHWHFSDDEAFRVEVTCAPELWQRTAIRGEGQMVPGVYGGGIRAGGSYSKADVARVVARAKALQIEVLPEIEVPAHGYALNIARHGMRDPGDNSMAISVHGYPDNVINPAMPDTWALLEPLALEVAGMFPIGILHLGCDELPPAAWSASPAIETLKAEQGLITRDDVQGWMMARLGGFLQARGIRSAAWEEAAKGANGGLGHGALLFSWTGQGPGVAAARAGYDVVMCPAQNIYFDMAHTASPEDWGAAWAAYVALEDVMNWKPVPAGAEDIAHKVAGVQGCFWSEFTTKDAEMEPMLAPRILGLANKGWDKHDGVDGPGLRSLAQCYGPILDQMGWQRHKGA